MQNTALLFVAFLLHGLLCFETGKMNKTAEFQSSTFVDLTEQIKSINAKYVNLDEDFKHLQEEYRNKLGKMRETDEVQSSTLIDLTEQLKSLNTKYVRLEEDNHNNLGKMRETAEVQSSTLIDLTEQLKSLDAKYVHHDEDLQKLQEEYQNNLGRIEKNAEAQLVALENLSEKSTSIDANYVKLDEGLKTLQEEYQNHLDDNELVAFSIYLEETMTLVPGNVIRFDGITTNVGNHYNPVIGHCVCPKTGLYALSLNLTSERQKAFCIIMKEGKRIAPTCIGCNAAFDAYFDHASANVVSECRAGERLWVEVRAYRTFVSSHSTFSGHLIGKQ